MPFLGDSLPTETMGSPPIQPFPQQPTVAITVQYFLQVRYRTVIIGD